MEKASLLNFFRALRQPDSNKVSHVSTLVPTLAATYIINTTRNVQTINEKKIKSYKKIQCYRLNSVAEK